MTLRQARKILVTGRPLTTSGRLGSLEHRARKIVLRHWVQQAWPRGADGVRTFSDAAEKRAHADCRALDAQRERLDARRMP